jgi:hypothetical protein
MGTCQGLGGSNLKPSNQVRKNGRSNAVNSLLPVKLYNLILGM